MTCAALLAALLPCVAAPLAHGDVVDTGPGWPSPDPPPATADPWLAQDKVQHFAMSFAVTGFAYAGARVALDPGAARAAAAATALAAGVAKEIYDARAGRWFSVPDLVWDAAGVALGFALVQRIR